MNPLYLNQMLMGNLQRPQMGFTNPIQKANAIMQALQNPVQFVRQEFPDIPEDISNDPNQILRYIQQTRNISDNQLIQIINRFPRF